MFGNVPYKRQTSVFLSSEMSGKVKIQKGYTERKKMVEKKEVTALLTLIFPVHYYVRLQ